MKTTGKLMLLLMAGFINQAYAALIDVSGENYSIDTINNLAWLDLTATQGQSYNTIINSSWYLSGWRHATGEEIISLYESNLPSLQTSEVIPDPNFPLKIAGDYWAPPQFDRNGKVQSLLAILGATSSTAYGPYTYGIFGREVLCTGGCTAHGIASFGWTSDRSGNSLVQAIMEGGAQDQYGHGYIGHFLVNDSIVTTVPLPSSIIFLISGLFSFGLLKKTKTPNNQLHRKTYPFRLLASREAFR